MRGGHAECGTILRIVSTQGQILLACQLMTRRVVPLCLKNMGSKNRLQALQSCFGFRHECVFSRFVFSDVRDAKS